MRSGEGQQKSGRELPKMAGGFFLWSGLDKRQVWLDECGSCLESYILININSESKTIKTQ